MKKITIFTILTTLICLSAQAKGPKLRSTADSVNYLMGNSIGTTLSTDPFIKAAKILDSKLFITGLKDALDGKAPLMDDYELYYFLNNYYNEIMEREYENNVRQGEEFLEKNRRNPGVVETESGLQYRIIEPGYGPTPGSRATVTLRYTAKRIDGELIEESDDYDGTETFHIRQVIDGMEEGLQLMPEGSSFIFWVPSELAYGQSNYRNFRAGELVIYEVTMVSFEDSDEDDDDYEYDYTTDDEDYYQGSIRVVQAGDYTRLFPETLHYIPDPEIDYYYYEHQLWDRRFVIDEEYLQILDEEGNILVDFSRDGFNFSNPMYYEPNDPSSPRFVVITAMEKYADEPWLELYTFDDSDMLRKVGLLHVTMYEYDSDENGIDIYNRDGGYKFTFNSYMVNYTNTETFTSARVQSEDLWYMLKDGILELQGPATDLSAFRREQLIIKVQKDHGEILAQIFGDLDGDGHSDLVFTVVNDPRLHFYHLRDYRFVKHTAVDPGFEFQLDDQTWSKFDREFSLFVNDYERKSFILDGNKIVPAE